MPGPVGDRDDVAPVVVVVRRVRSVGVADPREIVEREHDMLAVVRVDKGLILLDVLQLEALTVGSRDRPELLRVGVERQRRRVAQPIGESSGTMAHRVGLILDRAAALIDRGLRDPGTVVVREQLSRAVGIRDGEATLLTDYPCPDGSPLVLDGTSLRHELVG